MTQPAPHGYFEYVLAPGQTVSDAVQVVNPGDAPADFLVYAVDAYTSDLTGVVYQDRSSPAAQVGTWVTLSRTSVHLAGARSSRVAFAITAPKGLAAGDYVGGVAAENPVPSSGGTGRLAVKIIQRTVIAVVVHVPGLRQPGFSFGQPHVAVEAGRRQVLEIPMSSTGNVLTKPYLSGDISSCEGHLVVRLDRQLDTFVPHTSITYPDYLDHLLLAQGCYRVSLTATLSNTVLAHRVATIQVTPAQERIQAGSGGPAGLGLWVLAPLLFGLLLGTWFWFIPFLRRRRPRSELKLSQLQIGILDLTAQGFDNWHVAERLGLSFPGVRYEIEEAKRTLHAHSEFEAVTRARQLGLLSR